MKIKTGDNVKVLRGKDRGKTGKVIQVFRNKQTNDVRVVVDGVNLLKKHLRPQRRGDSGQVIELPAPIHVSNVMIIDANGKSARVGYNVDGEAKQRISKQTGETLN